MANFRAVKTGLWIAGGFLFLMIYLPVNSLFAQDLVIRSESYVSKGYAYSKDSASAGFINYLVLRELAREHLVEIPFVKLAFSANVQSDVYRDTDGQTFIKLRIRDKHASGDTRFRGFDLSQDLIPASGTIEVIHADKFDSALSTAYWLTQIRLNDPSADIPPIPISSYNPARDTLTVRMSSLVFGKQELYRLLDRIDLINDYYASASLLDTVLVRGPAIRTDSAAVLPFSLLDIMELARVTDLVIARDFDSTLLNGGPDPRGLRIKQHDALRMTRTLVYNFLDGLAKAGTVVPAAGIDSIASCFVDGMIRYIRLSGLMSDISGNIYNQYLDQYFSISVFPDELMTIRSLLSKIWPAASADTLLPYVSGKIYAAYQSRARMLTGQGRYAEAFVLVRHARLFRQKNPWLKASNGTEELLAEAAKGVYASYMGIAATSIDYEKFEMAEVYIRKALDYKRTNEAWFSADTLYGSVFRKLFRRRLFHCDQMITEGLYREAVDCYNEFEGQFDPELVAMVSGWIAAKKDTAWQMLFDEQEKRARYFLKETQYDSLFLVFDQLCVTRTYLRTDTTTEKRYQEIRKEVLPLKYATFSTRTHSSLEQRDYRNAWTAYLVADSVAAQTGILHDSAFCAMQRDIYRYHLAEELSLKTGYIWADQFDSARIFLEGVKERVETMGLSDDTVLAGAMENYRKKILLKKCLNRSEEADILVLRASRNAEQGRYAAAYRQFSEAMAVLHEMPECGLTNASLSDSLGKYGPPALYQSMLDTLQMNYIVRNYPAVFSLLARLEQDYQIQGLIRFGLPSVTIKDFVTQKNDPSLTLAAAEWLVSKNLPDEALTFLKRLRAQGTMPGPTADVQARLGTLLAQRDIEAGKAGNCKQNLAAYTANEKWYRVFEKAYCLAFR